MLQTFEVGIALGLSAGALLGYVVMYCYFHSRRLADEADERRKMHFMPGNENPYVTIPSSVVRTAGLHWNSRGMVMANQQYIPKDGPVRAVVGICHGFGDHTNDIMVDFAVKLVEDGYAVLMMDVEGHGLSDGLHGCIHDLQLVAADLGQYFVDQMETNNTFNNKPFFIYGISMGGAVAFNIATIPQCKAVQRILKGVVMCAPMVKVSDELKPADIVVNILSLLARLIPYAPLTPIPNVVDRCFKDPATLKRATDNRLSYNKPPRLRTALTMLEATNDISNRMADLTLPVLILHGGADIVTCPKLSAALYENCSSEDKTLRIYPGCWHDMFAGESPEQISIIYGDMIQWMKERWV